LAVDRHQPIAQAEPPAQPKANPQPPTAEQAARILGEAWNDPEWGLLVWLTMVTGFRRGELCGLRWRHLELDAGVIQLERSIGQRSGRTWEKGTKTHQHRRIALDPETVALLTAHRQRCLTRAHALGLELADEAFVFSTAVDGSTRDIEVEAPLPVWAGRRAGCRHSRGFSSLPRVARRYGNGESANPAEGLTVACAVSQ